jgi:hypothetical protein
MTASDKKKAKILVALVILAGVVWFWLYRPGSTSSTGAAAKAASKANDVKVGQDAQIRTDLLGDNAAEDVGRKNLFQYRQKAPPPQTATVARGFTPPTPPQNYTPPPYTPPTPQSKVFRYEGFSGPTKNGKLLASLSEGGNTYYAREGECIMGQYCVRRLTETQVEIEDIVLNSRRTFQRVQAQ